MKVGVIGLGNMGMGAALNLLRKGHEVTGCEIREETRAAFASEGGKVVASPDALPTDLEAVVVFVVNAAQTDQVLFGEKGCLARMAKGRRRTVLCHRRAGGRQSARTQDRGCGLPDGGLPGLWRRGGCSSRDDDRHGFRFRGSFRQGRTRAGGDLHQSLAAWRRDRRRQHGQDGQSVAGRSAYRDGGRGAGPGHPGRRRSGDAVQGDLGVRPAVPGCGKTGYHIYWRGTIRRPRR